MEWMEKFKTKSSHQLSGRLVKKNSVLLNTVWFFWSTDKKKVLAYFPHSVYKHMVPHSFTQYLQQTVSTECQTHWTTHSNLVNHAGREKTASQVNTSPIPIGNQHTHPVLESSINVKWLFRAKKTEVLFKIKQNAFILQITGSCRVLYKGWQMFFLHVKLHGF